MTVLTFPLTLDAFWETLEMQNIQLYDDQPQNFSQTAGGEIIRASIGASLWKGQIQLWKNEHADQQKIEAYLSLLQRPGASFFARDMRQIGPQYDPDGSIIGSNTPTLLSVESNNREISIQGLPANYEIRAGDLISFQYGSPTIYGFHRVVQGVTANGSGSTGVLEVSPPLQPGASVTDPVQLVKPYFKAKLQPGPSYGAADSGLSQGPSFSFVQTLN